MKAVKLVVLGDGAVGKTSMLISQTTGQFPGEQVPAVIDNYAQDITVDGNSFNMGLWDAGFGEERLRPLAYPHTDVLVLSFSVSSIASFNNIQTKWIPEIRHHMPNTPFILVATKTDLRNDQNTIDRLQENECRGPVSSEEGQEMAMRVGASHYVECSALLGQGLRDVFENAVRAVLGSRGVAPRPPHAAQKLSKCAVL